MVKKNFLFILISLFAIAILFSGCSKQDNKATSNTNNIKVESDVSAQKIVETSLPKTENVVDSSFNTGTAGNNSDVEIGSLI